MENQLDQSVVNLAKSIRQTESGGDFSAKGKSGEFGGYQYTPDTWKASATKYGIKVPLEQATPEQQNAVTYNRIKAWKDKGHDVTEIASMWNAGEGEPKAYTGKFSNGTSSKGVNKYGVEFDVPSYAKKISDSYLSLKQQSPEQPQEQPTEKPKKEGLLKTIAKGIISPVATMLARPVQLGAELMGASAEDVNQKTKDVAGDWVAPVPESGKDVLKDVGRGAQTVALGMPVGGVKQAVKAGVVAGAGAGLEKEGTLEGAAKGGTIGAGLGLAGGGVSKVIEKFPKWMVKNALNLTDEQATKMLQTKTIGTKSTILNQSEKAIAKQGNETTEIIKAADKAGVRGAGNDSLRKTLLDYPEYATDKGVEKFATKIKSLIKGSPEVGQRGRVLSYVDKIIAGTATLEEKNLVRSALDQATKNSYTKLAKALNPNAGHEMAMKFADNLRTEVKSWVPDTIMLFDEQAKEMAIRAALSKIKQEGLIGYKDILPYMLGEGATGGLTGGLATAGISRVARSPATQFNIAKTAQTLGKVVKPAASRAGLLPMTIK